MENVLNFATFPYQANILLEGDSLGGGDLNIRVRYLDLITRLPSSYLQMFIASICHQSRYLRSDPFTRPVEIVSRDGLNIYPCKARISLILLTWSG